jgi:hypothetical protein
VGLDHIKLDRAWLFDDIECVNVHRVSKKPSYAQPFFEVSEASSLLLHLRIVSSSSPSQLERILHGSWIAQHFVSFTAILLDKLSRTVNGMSKAFDEESETGAWFVDQADGIAQSRDWFMRASRRVCLLLLLLLSVTLI